MNSHFGIPYYAHMIFNESEARGVISALQMPYLQALKGSMDNTVLFKSRYSCYNERSLKIWKNVNLY